jgi:hypothetical protein
MSQVAHSLTGLVRDPILIGAPVKQWMCIHVAAFVDHPVIRRTGQIH